VRHLQKLGINASADQVYTSTQASIEFLREEMPAVRRLFVLGTLSMRVEIEAAGFVLTADDADDEPMRAGRIRHGLELHAALPRCILD
jgi:NagD protein